MKVSASAGLIRTNSVSSILISRPNKGPRRKKTVRFNLNSSTEHTIAVPLKQKVSSTSKIQAAQDSSSDSQTPQVKTQESRFRINKINTIFADLRNLEDNLARTMPRFGMGLGANKSTTANTLRSPSTELQQEPTQQIEARGKAPIIVKLKGPKENQGAASSQIFRPNNFIGQNPTSAAQISQVLSSRSIPDPPINATESAIVKRGENTHLLDRQLKKPLGDYSKGQDANTQDSLSKNDIKAKYLLLRDQFKSDTFLRPNPQTQLIQANSQQEILQSSNDRELIEESPIRTSSIFGKIARTNNPIYAVSTSYNPDARTSTNYNFFTNGRNKIVNIDSDRSGVGEESNRKKTAPFFRDTEASPGSPEDNINLHTSSSQNRMFSKPVKTRSPVTPTTAGMLYNARLHGRSTYSKRVQAPDSPQPPAGTYLSVSATPITSSRSKQEFLT